MSALVWAPLVFALVMYGLQVFGLSLRIRGLERRARADRATLRSVLAWARERGATIRFRDGEP